MAEDVINNLEKMTLMTEEEEVIAVSDEGRKEEIERCAQSLIGKFLTCKPFNKRAGYVYFEEILGAGGECTGYGSGNKLIPIQV